MAASVVYFSDADFSFMTNDPLKERESFTEARRLMVRHIYSRTSLTGSWRKESPSFVCLNVCVKAKHYSKRQQSFRLNVTPHRETDFLIEIPHLIVGF